MNEGQICRRDFSALMCATYFSLAAGNAYSDEQDGNAKRLDLHVHLFGIGDSGSGCRVTEKVSNGYLFNYLKRMLGLDQVDSTLDKQYERVLARQIRESDLTKAAVLAQDAVYDNQGKPDWDATSFYVPNDYLFEVVKRHPELMIACPSINPNRADALDELDRISELGARMLKIHPPTQNVDLLDDKHIPFIQRCQELKMVVLVHTGHEHSAPVFSIDLAAPHRLHRLLDEGCTVVACHAGSGWFIDRPDYLVQFLRLIERFDNLWGDTAVLGTAMRFPDFGRLLDAGKDVCSRLLHGSDFPFPASPSVFADRIGQEDALKLSSERNLIQRDYALKLKLGIGMSSAKRAYALVHRPR